MRFSIIIPVLNEAASIQEVLGSVRSQSGCDMEVIVVDGGSGDDTVALATPMADKLVQSSRGRANQMNAGAGAASGDVLLFLHADTLLPDHALPAILAGLGGSGHAWGRFDVQIAGTPWMLRVVAFCMNTRSRLTGIATGDQAIFVRKEAFVSAGGFPALPLMEDIALSSILKKQSRPLCLRSRVTTSGRRWETKGVWRTIFLMWSLRLRYWLGADTAALARTYQ